MTDRRPLLRTIFDAAVAAAHPDVVLSAHLRPIPKGRVICLAAGKGAGAMAGAGGSLQMAVDAGADDLLLVLLSGGGSANWIAPVEGVSFIQKQQVTRALLRSGAPIGEVNTVRKHLSR